MSLQWEVLDPIAHAVHSISTKSFIVQEVETVGDHGLNVYFTTEDGEFCLPIFVGKPRHIGQGTKE